MIRFRKIICLLLFFSASYSFSQISLIDSTKFDRVGNKKNGFFIEALGASSLAGIFYQRSFPLAQKKLHLRLIGGFSPFTFFRFSISDGVSLPMGAGLYFFKSRFKLGLSMMVMHSFYFQAIEEIDYGFTPFKVTMVSYRLYLQPQLNFEYHFSPRFVGKICFSPTFMPEQFGGKIRYTFMPWGGVAFGYKF